MRNSMIINGDTHFQLIYFCGQIVYKDIKKRRGKHIFMTHPTFSFKSVWQWFIINVYWWPSFSVHRANCKIEETVYIRSKQIILYKLSNDPCSQMLLWSCIYLFSIHSICILEYQIMYIYEWNNINVSLFWAIRLLMGGGPGALV